MESTTTIVCIGELLWEVLPTGRRPGGAPLGTAAALRQLGQPVQLISRVGDDELGHELLACVARTGLGTQLIQRSHSHLTGVGKTSVRNGDEAVQQLVGPVAWDYLQYTPELQTAVSQARAVVYSSVLARHAVARETLYRLLPLAGYRVFDARLRPSHCGREVVKYLLRQADLVYLTAAELTEIAGWLGQPADEATALPWLASYFGLHAVCVAPGPAGAALWLGGQLFQAAAAPVAPADAFLPTLLTGLLAGHSPADCLRRASGAGAPATAGASALGLPTPAVAGSAPVAWAEPARA